MPVFEWDLDLQASEWDWREAAGPLPDMYDVSEDFWRKFEELPDLGDDLESLLESAVCSSDPNNVLRHHDCMWAGMCLSKEHKNLVTSAMPLPPPPLPPPPPPAPIIRQPVTVTTTVTTTPNNNTCTDNKSNTTEKPKREPRRKGVIVQKTVGRSLLINSRTRIPEPTRPETPPSLSESEEDDKKSVPVVPVSEVTNQVSVRRQMTQQPLHQTTNLNVQFDHNYDKSVRLDDLGVQTPSDSEEEEDDDEEEEQVEEEDDDAEGEEEGEECADEDSEEEEIDVVSLNSTAGTVRVRNQPNSLPYNPSREMRRELQDTVASAITSNKLLSASRTVNRRISNGPGRRKRKRDDSDDEDEERTLMQQQQQQQQQQALLNSRVMPSSGQLSGANSITYSSTSTPRYHHPHHRRPWRRTTVTSTTTSSKRSKFSTDSETDSEKRSLHNNMERMRRIGLRNAFEDLRVLIPSLKESKRAAKVNILKDSAVYVRQLTIQERSLSQKVMSLHYEQEKLRSRLSKLRRSLAAHR